MQAFLNSKHDAYIFHDFMEEVNEPLHFYEFVERAQVHGLQYLANADFRGPDNVDDEVIGHLFEISDDIIEVEQHLDFLTNRMFRETALCHKEISVDRTLKPDVIYKLRVASQVEPGPPILDITTTERVEFSAANESALSTAHPLTKAALRYLAGVWPRIVSFDKLLTSAAKMLNLQTIDHAETEILATNLLTAYSQNMNLVALHNFAPVFVTSVSSKPVVCPTARFQAEQGYPITNMYHRRVDVGDMLRHLLPHMDGSKSHTDLLDILVELTADGVLTVTQDDKPVDDDNLAKQILADELDTHLQQLAQTALLIG